MRKRVGRGLITALILAVSVNPAALLADDGAGSNEPISSIPFAAFDVDPRIAELGRRLFHEPRLSRDDTLSCAFCHPLDRGGNACVLNGH